MYGHDSSSRFPIYGDQRHSRHRIEFGSDYGGGGGLHYKWPIRDFHCMWQKSPLELADGECMGPLN